MDFIRVGRIEQRLAGLTRLGNKAANLIGVTRFAAQSPVANLSLGCLPSQSLPANSAGSLAAGVVPSPALLEQGAGPIGQPGALPAVPVEVTQLEPGEEGFAQGRPLTVD